MVSRLRTFVLLLLGLACVPAWAAGTDYADIQQLLLRGEGESAYARMSSMQTQHEGELEFDLLLAQSALMSGRANIALFVIERILLLHPTHAQARLLMASAYMHLGQPLLARNELDALLKNPSLHPQLREQAQTLLQGIETAERKDRLRGFVAFAYGFDSNANASTSEQTFLGFNLNPQSIAAPSLHSSMDVGLSWSHVLENKSEFYSSLEWRSDAYPQASFVDNEASYIQLGWQRPKRYSLSIQSSSINVAGAYNNAANYLYGVWYPGAKRESNLFLRLGQQNYTALQSIQDVSQYQLGGQISLAAWSAATQLVLILGEDTALQTNSPYGRGLVGMNVQKTIKSLNPFTVKLGAGVLYSEYRGLFFGLDRQERQASLSVGIHTKRWKHWELGLDIVRNDTWSTISLYDYERLTFGLNFKRNFVR